MAQRMIFPPWYGLPGIIVWISADLGVIAVSCLLFIRTPPNRINTITSFKYDEINIFKWCNIRIILRILNQKIYSEK